MDHVESVGGQQPQVDRDLVRDPDGLQVGAHAGLVGDDPGVLRVGLPVAAIRRRGVVHDSARDIEQLLAVAGEQRDQQRRAAVGQVRRPADLAVAGELDHGGDQVEQRGLVVADLRRQPNAAVAVDDDAVMRAFAGVDSGPKCRHGCVSSRSGATCCSPVDDHAGTSLPNDQCRNSQSAVEPSAGSGRPFPVSRPSGRATTEPYPLPEGEPERYANTGSGPSNNVRRAI